MDSTARGKFDGGDAAWEEERLGSYSHSEVRLVEIQEKLCSGVERGKIQVSMTVDVCLSNVQLTAVQLTAVRITAVQLTAVRLAAVRLAAFQLAAVQFTAVQYIHTQLSLQQIQTVCCNAYSCIARLNNKETYKQVYHQLTAPTFDLRKYC
jgi:hypothetical protein